MKSSQLAKILMELNDKLGPDQGTKAFVEFLQQNNLTGYTENIIRHLHYIQHQHDDLSTLKITTKHNLSPGVINDIKQALGVPPGSPEQLSHDENVLGGFIAEYNGQQYDASLANTTNQLANQLTY